MANLLLPQFGEIVVIRQTGNVHDGARCVYIDAWTNAFGDTFHMVSHLHKSPTRGKTGWWYVKGQQTGWKLEDLYLDSVIQRAFYCGGCEQWFEGPLDYLCEGCRHGLT